MIETERQRQAAESWLAYWDTSLAAGEQSWVGHEEALETRIRLRTEIDAYDKQAGMSGSVSQE